MGWSKEQVDEFLTSEVRIGRLATASAAGEPHVVPVWYRHDGDRLLVHSMDGTKVQNVRANGRFSLTVDKDSPPYAGVTMAGSAEVLASDALDYKALVEDLAVRYLGAQMGGQMGPMIAGMPGEHVTLALQPERWESWDYSQ